MASSYKVIASASSNIRAAGGTLVCTSSLIASKAHAMNGSAFSSQDKIAYYRKRAAGRDPGAPNDGLRDFLGHGPNKTNHLDIPNGGIYRPEETAIWQGRLFRIGYAPKGLSDGQVVERILAGPWWMDYETMNNIALDAQNPTRLLEIFRNYLALGFKLAADTTRFIETPVAGPTIAFMGKANPASDNYDAQFPILGGHPFIKQLYIPGIRTLSDQPDNAVIASVFNASASNIYDAPGFYGRYGRGQG